MNHRNKYRLRCPQCGTVILAQASERLCYKCGTPMVLIGKEGDKKNG